jgi:hypothetical protein
MSDQCGVAEDEYDSYYDQEAIEEEVESEDNVKDEEVMQKIKKDFGENHGSG